MHIHVYVCIVIMYCVHALYMKAHADFVHVHVHGYIDTDFCGCEEEAEEVAAFCCRA